MYTSELIGIVGQTGTGKSTSLRKLDASSTFIINIYGKPLPFKGAQSKYKKWTSKTDEGKKGNYLSTTDTAKILQMMEYISTSMPHIKRIVIDDYQYILSDEFMKRASEKGWDKFTDIAKHAWQILEKGKSLRGDLKVYVLTHDEVVTTQDYGTKRKIKTIGKMLDDKITLEGMFTIVLFTHVEKDPNKELPEYYFITQNDGSTTAKSPMGMFDKFKVPNDLTYVESKINDYK